MVTSSVLTAEEARDKTNGVGLDRAIWDGSLFSLVLLDGTAIEIKSMMSNREGEANSFKPSLSFIHKKLGVFPPKVERY